MTFDQTPSEDSATGPRPQERWQLTANTPENYERHLVPALFGRWATRLVELAAPAPGERVLDVACGTGIVARRAAALVQPGGAVAGLDSNQAMLEVASAAAADVHPPIDWRAGDAADLPFPDGAFEAVLCQQGLQFFPDREAALRQMRRVLVPQGRLAVAMWRPIQHAPGFGALAQALERHAGADLGAIMHRPFGGPDAATLRQLLADAGFSGVRLRIGIGEVRFPSPEEFLRRQVAGSPLAGPVGALDAETQAALTRDLDRSLQGYLDDDGVAFPIQAWLVTARPAG